MWRKRERERGRGREGSCERPRCRGASRRQMASESPLWITVTGERCSERASFGVRSSAARGHGACTRGVEHASAELRHEARDVSKRRRARSPAPFSEQSGLLPRSDLLLLVVIGREDRRQRRLRSIREGRGGDGEEGAGRGTEPQNIFTQALSPIDQALIGIRAPTCTGPPVL